MKNETKKFSPVVFGLAIIAFFLTFIHIRTQWYEISVLTGIQLVTGTTITQTEFDGAFYRPQDVGKEDIDTEPLAIFALCSTFAGLLLSFKRGKCGAIATAIAGIVGFILLLLLKDRIDNDALKEVGVQYIGYGSGFWLLLVLFLCAIGLNAYLYLQEGREEQVLATESQA